MAGSLKKDPLLVIVGYIWEPGSQIQSHIIRNRLKIEAAITNAKLFLDVQKEFGTFDAYIWSFVKGKQLDHQLSSRARIPATTEESDAMSKDLRKRGFKFVGSTICYAFMQAV